MPEVSPADFPIIEGCSTHTKPHCPFSPLPSNRSERRTTLLLFPLVTPSRLTTSGIPKSPEVRLLIAATTSLHTSLRLRVPCTCSAPTHPMYSTSGQIHITEVNSSCLLILLFNTKHKTIRWYLGLTPRLHFREGELIRCVGTARNHVTNSRSATHKNWVVRCSPHATGF